MDKQSRIIELHKLHPSNTLKPYQIAIDDYLQMCKELKITPEKQCKGSLNVRLGVELHNKAKMKSIEKNISINELIKNAVIAYLETNKSRN